MKRRAPIVVALAVALAFAASGGPRHARAAAQDHDHPAAASHSHAHHESGSGHSHAAESGDYAESGNHDHAGTPAVDQGCCYAWCTSIAIIQAADWPLIAAAHGEHFAFEKPFRIAALSAAIDPPPR
jgi:hypothetical protein